MKKTLYLKVLLIFGLAMNAQKIVPLENKYNYKFINRNEEVYFKDVNNILEKYLGTWEGTYGDKKYEFRIVKNTGSYMVMKYDELLIRYIVTDLKNNIIENTTSLLDSDTYIIEGHNYNNGWYLLLYHAKGGNFAQRGEIRISVNNKNMDAFFRSTSDIVDSTKCPTVINQFFPRDTIFKLIKQ
jgi:hypothetical protein